MAILLEWIVHLNNPLVLVGFSLFILALVLKPTLSKISGTATERILSRTINLSFILSVLIIISGFTLSLTRTLKIIPPKQKDISDQIRPTIPVSTTPASMNTNCDKQQTMTDIRSGRNISQSTNNLQKSCQLMKNIEANRDITQKSRNQGRSRQSMKNIKAGGSVEQSN